MDEWYAICFVCEYGINDNDDEYKYAVNPETGEDYYVHDGCLDEFHESTLMGFCDLCDGTTWLPGYNVDSIWDTDPATGNHVECETEYWEHHKTKETCYNAQCEYHQPDD